MHTPQHSGNFATHEVCELHELIGFKTTCMVKAQNMFNLVQDQGLQQLLVNDVNNGRRHIQELHSLLKQALPAFGGVH